MKRGEVRDAAATMRELDCRLLNRDAEGLLMERLGAREKAWVHEWATRPPVWLRQVTGVLNSWIIPELIFPDGPCEESESLRGHHWSDEEKNRMHIVDDNAQVINSFGVGVFIGATLHQMLVLSGEATDETVIFGTDFSLLDAFYALDKSQLNPSDITDKSVKPWFKKTQEYFFLARNRMKLNEAFGPIVHPGESRDSGPKRLSYRHLRQARRSMLLAGLISSGFTLPSEDFLPGTPELHREPAELHGEPAGSLEKEGALELYERSDEELESLLGENHLGESIKEELRFRLRISRLSRMLAHLERTSEDENKDNGASRNE